MNTLGPVRVEFGAFSAHSDDSARNGNPNEDAFAFLNEGSTDFAAGVVADGVGGNPQGEVASTLVSGGYITGVYNAAHQNEGAGILDVMAAGMRGAHTALAREKASQRLHPKAASTIVSLLVHKPSGEALVGYAGDSFAAQVLLGGLHRLTTPHHNEEGHLVECMLGTRVPNYSVVRLGARNGIPDRTRFVLGSDGVDEIKWRDDISRPGEWLGAAINRVQAAAASRTKSPYQAARDLGMASAVPDRGTSVLFDDTTVLVADIYRR